jgi:hypothetical protein
MSFMNKIFPAINGAIPVDKDAFLASLKDEIINTSHEHLNMRIKVESRESDLTIKTARRIPQPLDNAILFGTFQPMGDLYYFKYTISARKSVLILIPWFVLVLIFIVYGLIIAVTINLVGLLFAGLCAFAFIHSAKSFIRNYQKDANFLESIVNRNKTTQGEVD